MIGASRLFRVLLLVAVAGSSACVANPRPRVGIVYVSRQPPVERVEVIAVRPGAAHVWIGGHWTWRDPEFVWISGRWEMPGAGFREWVPGHWARDRFGWYFIDGHWR